MDRVSCKRDNFLGLQNYKVQMMFITLPVSSAKKPRKQRDMEGGLGSFPTHTKESYQG